MSLTMTMTTPPVFLGYDSIADTLLGVESVVANQRVFVEYIVVEECRRVLALDKIFVNRHVTQVCRILQFQYKMICVSISFSLSSFVGRRDLLDVVQEHAVFERPSMFLLTVSVGSVVSPPSCKRRKLSFLAIWGNIYGVPVMVLPLFKSMAFSLSSSLDNVQRLCKDVDSYFVFFSCEFLRGVSNIYRIRSKLFLLWNVSSK